MSENSAVTNTVAKVAGAGIAGTAIGLATTGAVQTLHPAHGRGGLPYAAGNFAATTSNALKHGASLSTALGAGATAAVGGPAVVAAAVAAAPVVVAVAGVAAGAAAIYGLYRWISGDK